MPDGVQFDEWRPTRERQPGPSGLVKFAMRFLGAKNEHDANTILLGMAVIFFILTAIVIFKDIL